MKSRERLVPLLVLAAIYVVAARLGFTMATAAEQVTLVWPATGIALGALLLYGTDLWPGIFLGAFLANALAHEPLWAATAIAAGNTIEALLAVWLLRRVVGFGTSIDRLRQAVGLLLFGAVASTAASATIGATTLCLAGIQPWSAYGTLWWTWWLGDAAGDLLIAPAMLTGGVLTQIWRSERRVEAISLIVALVIITTGIFGGWFTTDPTSGPLEYAVFPFVIWAAIRFGVPGVSLVHLVTASVAVAGTMLVMMASGPGPTEERLVLLQVFLSVMAATGLLLGAAITEREASTRRRHAEYMVTLVLGAVTGENEAIRQILQIACKHLDWDVGLSWRVDPEAGVLRCSDFWAKPPRAFPELERISRTTTLPVGSDLPGRVWARNEPFCWIANRAQDAGCSRLEAAAAERLAGAFLFPIGVDHELLGVFEFFSRGVRQPDAELLQMFAAVGTEVGQFLARKRVERQVRESEARKTAVLEAALDCIITIDREGHILEFNPASERTFGYRGADVLGKDIAELIVPAKGEDAAEGLVQFLETDEFGAGGRRFETTAKRADGTEFPVELSVARTASPGQPLFTAYLRDITEQKQLVKQLAFRATHDGLTQTLNRASLLERLREAIERGGTHGRQLMAVFFVDMDGFKDINNRLGHLAGDRLLVAVARRLQASVRPADAVGRLGGDEFAILLEHVANLRDAKSVADRVQESLRRPFELDRHQVIATASIGVALTWAGDDPPVELLRTADTAMYEAKAMGRGRYRVIDLRRAPAHVVEKPEIDTVRRTGSS